MSEGGYFLGQGGGVDHGSIDGFPVCPFPQRLLDHGLDVEVAHGLFEDGEAVERYLQVGQVGAENRGPASKFLWSERHQPWQGIRSGTPTKRFARPTSSG